MNIDDIFQQVESKFCLLGKSVKEEWSKKSKILHLKKGHTLVQEGERSTKVWFIIQGNIRAYYIKDGKKICDWFAFKNEFVCALSSFYSDSPSFHQIDLLSDAILLETKREDILELGLKYAEVERLGRLSATETMIRLQERIVSMQFESASQRLENLLQKHPNIYQDAPLGDIASYIGITQETLSRIRGKSVRI